jgi:hypothetical protein
MEAQNGPMQLASIGSEEHAMINLSLARIMYGTNEDLHTWSAMSGATFPSRASSVDRATRETAVAQNSLGALLHKAWTSLRHKD